MQTALKKKKPVKRAAVLHDLCTVGKAAMTNILPVLSVMGVEACPVPTMVLSTHTGGFGKPYIHSLEDFSGGCAAHLKENGFSFDGILVGYLGNQENLRGAKAFLQEFDSGFVLFDPIMADHGRYYANFDGEYREKLKELIPLSTLMTPNYTEACFLTGETYEESLSEAAFHRMAGRLRSLGNGKAVITSIPLKEGMALGLVEEGEEELLPYETVGRAYPGTGDLFSAVLLGALLRGKSLRKSALAAHSFVKACIVESDRAGYDTREGILLESQLSVLPKICQL